MEIVGLSLCAVVYAVLHLIVMLDATTVYTDRYGDCFRDSYISVKHGEVYTVLSKGGEPYDTTVCSMVFKSETNDRLCLRFKSFRIDRCDLKLTVYAESSVSGTAIGNYNCHTEEVPETLCSSGKYLTIEQRKEELSHEHYYFHLEVREFTSSDAFAEGIDVFIVSIGVIIAIIVGVIVLVVLTAVVIVYCCCKGNNYGIRHKQSRKSTSYRTAASEVPLEPSAPPFQAEDTPPAYSEPPPPYSTTDIQDTHLIAAQNGQDLTHSDIKTDEKGAFV